MFFYRRHGVTIQTIPIQIILIEFNMDNPPRVCWLASFSQAKANLNNISIERVSTRIGRNSVCDHPLAAYFENFNTGTSIRFEIFHVNDRNPAMHIKLETDEIDVVVEPGETSIIFPDTARSRFTKIFAPFYIMWNDARPATGK